MKILLDKSKKYYKANLHTHSDMSDGRCTREELKERFKNHGYSVVAFTDHEHLIDNSYLNDEDFLAITSCEVAIKQFPKESTLVKTDMKVTHMNFYATDPHNTDTPCYAAVYDHYLDNCADMIVKPEVDFEREYSADGINKMIQIAKEQGFIVSYNHPGWSLETAEDYLNYDGLFAVEIYNTGCVKQGFSDDEHVFDEMLRSGKRLFCTACDDCHNLEPFESVYNDSFGGWVQINADKLDYNTIMNALQNGDFYASNGVEIYSLVLDGDVVKIETSAAEKIVLIPNGRNRQIVIANPGESVTSAEFKLSPRDKYFRIRVEGKNNEKAYTQAYFVE